jgi:uncharacterized repeat protein (TIGR03837 family)
LADAASPDWELFCTVIDHFGDAGVAWRLARLLAREHGAQVRLWIDDVARLARLDPRLDAAREVQQVEGIEVRAWHENFAATEPARVVLALFSCRVPEAHIEAMARAGSAWINLDYLSAEAWVEGCHRKPSPHPRLPIIEHFFYPGFSTNTGGLLREAGLIERLDAVREDAATQVAFWKRIGLPSRVPDELRVSLFCYPHAPAHALFDALAAQPRPVTCLLCDAPARDWRGPEHVHLLPAPFLSQDDYDRLLAACDLNFVRGEDSFVRAQWAARPFVWHIYAQAEQAHLPKLQAFVARYATDAPAPLAGSLASAFDAWNSAGDARTALSELIDRLPQAQAHARRWRAALLGLPELAAELVGFARKLL